MQPPLPPPLPPPKEAASVKFGSLTAGDSSSLLQLAVNLIFTSGRQRKRRKRKEHLSSDEETEAEEEDEQYEQRSVLFEKLVQLFGQFTVSPRSRREAPEAEVIGPLEGFPRIKWHYDLATPPIEEELSPLYGDCFHEEQLRMQRNEYVDKSIVALESIRDGVMVLRVQSYIQHRVRHRIFQRLGQEEQLRLLGDAARIQRHLYLVLGLNCTVITADQQAVFLLRADSVAEAPSKWSSPVAYGIEYAGDEMLTASDSVKFFRQQIFKALKRTLSIDSHEVDFAEPLELVRKPDYEYIVAGVAQLRIGMEQVRKRWKQVGSEFKRKYDLNYSPHFVPWSSDGVKIFFHQQGCNIAPATRTCAKIAKNHFLKRNSY